VLRRCSRNGVVVGFLLPPGLADDGPWAPGRCGHPGWPAGGR